MDSEPDIPSARVAAFVRQFTHDIRNGLNSLDLETGLLDEFVVEDEGKESLRRIRKQIRSLAEALRSVTGHFQNLRPAAAPIAASELFLIWREQHALLSNPPEVLWEDQLGDQKVSVDVEMIAHVFRELFVNAKAFSHGDPLRARAWCANGAVLFELTEPKKENVDPGSWGEPLSTTRCTGYGLGLWAARRSVEANGAKLMQRYDPEKKVLSTQIILAAV